MKAVNILKTLANDPHTSVIAECWSRGFPIEECCAYLDNDPEFDNILFSRKMIEGVYDLLEEQQDLDLDEYAD